MEPRRILSKALHFMPWVLLMASCNGQGDAAPTRSSTASGTQGHAAYSDTTDQLAEYVVDAFADSKGVLWFGTMGKGVARFDGKELTFLHPADGKGGNVVSSVAEDKGGKLWFAGHDGTGLVHYDGTRFTQVWEDESTVSSDASGTIWASTLAGIFRYDGAVFKPFPVPVERSKITTYAIHPGNSSFALEDSKGDLWFRTDGAGAYRYDGTTFKQFTKADGLCSNTVNDIVEDNAGNIWFICMQAYQPSTTGDGGLCMWNGTEFTSFPEVDGLHHNDLYTLFKDQSGNLWIGATGVGAYRYDGRTFTLFDRTDRPDLNASFGLQGMAEDQHGTLWCGFSGGLFRLDPANEGASFRNVTRNGPWE